MGVPSGTEYGNQQANKKAAGGGDGEKSGLVSLHDPLSPPPSTKLVWGRGKSCCRAQKDPGCRVPPGPTFPCL